MKYVVGVDEAGRGPLAGPVAVGVVAVPEGFDIAKEFPGVADSKKLTEKKREVLMALLEARAAQGDLAYRVEFESAETIDKEGIAEAVRRALNRGVHTLAETLFKSDLNRKPDIHIQLDGALRAPLEYSQETIIHGDALVPLISLASIAAKVTRDRLMLDLAREYPEYQFEKHKGYGTALHYELIRKYGLSAIHRKTFVHFAPQ